MPRIAQTFTRYVWPTITTVFILTAIKDTKQTSFGAKEGDKPTDPAWVWEWVPVEDSKLKAEEQRKFMFTTGVTFGSKKSKLTKIYNGLEGRNAEGAVGLTNAEAEKIDADQYIGKAHKLTLLRELSDTGEPVNRLGAIEPATEKDIKQALAEAKAREAAEAEEDAKNAEE